MASLFAIVARRSNRKTTMPTVSARIQAQRTTKGWMLSSAMRRRNESARRAWVDLRLVISRSGILSLVSRLGILTLVRLFMSRLGNVVSGPLLLLSLLWSPEGLPLWSPEGPPLFVSTLRLGVACLQSGQLPRLACLQSPFTHQVHIPQILYSSGKVAEHSRFRHVCVLGFGMHFGDLHFPHFPFTHQVHIAQHAFPDGKKTPQLEFRHVCHSASS